MKSILTDPQNTADMFVDMRKAGKSGIDVAVERRKMNEYDFFVYSIPYIAEIIANCRKMRRNRYEEWRKYQKRELYESAKITPDVKAFMEKIFLVIDTYV